jgi:16S rRNA (uracil1498-N3)-methyltransferase
MHRFYLPPERCVEKTLRLEGREAHHGLHVLRLKRDETVTVLDGAGNEYFCAVSLASRDYVSLAVKAKTFTPALPARITLLQAIPKGKIMESIIQKGVELGVNQIVPLVTDRVISQFDGEGAEQKREKWQQVAIEAIKQCGAAWLPHIAAPVKLSQYLRQPESLDLSLVGSLQPERSHPRKYLEAFQQGQGRPPQTVGIWIGPEGDFTLEELHAIEAAGARPITLGRLVLRVETAAIYCLSFLNYELNSQSNFPPPPTG